MTTLQDRVTDPEINPLDCVEEVLSANNWVFNRMTDDELMVQVSGKGCDYRVFFIWQHDMNALQFCCQYDLKIESKRMGIVSKTLKNMNENVWMGHFDVPEETGTPSFRHTCLLRGVSDILSPEHFEDLVDISLVQCERHFPVFSMLADNDNHVDDQALSLALIQPDGRA